MAKSKPRYGYGTRKPSPVDVHVGARVRMRRTLLGMTQSDLGELLGLTFQQVQKYENGANRIGSGRLYDLARVLDLPIEHFFEDIPAAVAASSPAKGRGKTKEPPGYDLDPMTKRETLELVRAYYKIENVGVRKVLYEMAKALGADAGMDS